MVLPYLQETNASWLKVSKITNFSNSDINFNSHMFRFIRIWLPSVSSSIKHELEVNTTIQRSILITDIHKKRVIQNNVCPSVLTNIHFEFNIRNPPYWRLRLLIV